MKKKMKMRLKTDQRFSPVKRLAASFALAVMVFAAAGWQQATAHKYYAALSDVTYNAEAGSLEFVHRFFDHDMELALSQETGTRLSFERRDEIEPVLKAYMAAHLSVTVDGAPIERSWVGYELDGNNLWVYEEVPMATAPRHIAVENTMLMRMFADQVNTLNLTVGAFRQSLSFLKGRYSGELVIE